jgi:DNA excision repair protein ERCC-4
MVETVVVKILVDIEERWSAVPEHLVSLGVEVELVRLPHGDYLVDGRVAVERKTVADLHRSIANARLWSQVAGLAQFERAYVVVEGEDLDAGPISVAGVRGAVLQVVDNGVVVIRSASERDTAVWLRLLAVRGVRTGRLLGRRGRRRTDPSPVGVLTVVPGISPRLASALLERFGSIAALAVATRDELCEVDGIGPQRAAALKRALI